MSQEVINWIIAALGVMVGAIVKVMWDSLKALQETDQRLADKVANIEILVAGNYATRDHVDFVFRELSTALFRKLDKIEEKLDGKADK
jgi:hypothetical protein